MQYKFDIQAQQQPSQGQNQAQHQMQSSNQQQSSQSSNQSHDKGKPIQKYARLLDSFFFVFLFRSTPHKVLLAFVFQSFVIYSEI